MAVDGLEWMAQEQADERERIESRRTDRERELRARQSRERRERIGARDRKYAPDSDAALVAYVLTLAPLDIPSA